MKKLLSIILISMLIMSTVVSTSAYSTDKLQLAVEGGVQADENPDEIATNRYYFLMPDGTNGQKNPYEKDAENYGKYVASWYNEYTDTPAIYWDESSVFFPDDNSACSTSVEKGDSDCVFYADVPKSATTIVWSNNVEYFGASDPMFMYAMYTASIPCEYYDPCESDNYPDGVNSFDNMIYVLHAPISSTDRLPSASNEFFGEWYYYYGDGCYGTVENGTVNNCIRDDHDHRSFDEQLKDYEDMTGEKVETKRYYFLMPNGTNSEVCDNELYKNYGERPRSWYNENADHAGVYWWDKGLLAPKKWPGYKMNKSDAESVFYIDLPTYVDTVIFNNYFDSGTDWTDPIYFDCAQTIGVYLLGYDEGETDLYPEGLDTLENMIYVLEYDCDFELEPRNTWGGEWYYYYGDGCYGTVEDGTVDNCIRDDHEHHSESEFKYIDKIFERLGATEYYEQQEILDVYDELYYHYSDDNAQKPDWALVLCPLNPAPMERKDGTLVGDRILSVVGGGCAVFPDGYAVYVRETDKFIPLRQSNLEQIVELCPDFIEAIEENEIGQQFGDVDNDGELSIIDATYIQRFLAKLYDFIQAYYLVNLDGGRDKVSVCDFDRDGKTTIFDVTAIQRKLAGLDEAPNQQPVVTPD